MNVLKIIILIELFLMNYIDILIFYKIKKILKNFLY